MRAVREGPSLGRHSDYLGALRLNNGCASQHKETDIARPAAGLFRSEAKNCCGKIAAWNARDAGRYSSAKGWRNSSALWAFRTASVSIIVATTASASVGSTPLARRFSARFCWWTISVSILSIRMSTSASRWAMFVIGWNCPCPVDGRASWEFSWCAKGPRPSRPVCAWLLGWLNAARRRPAPSAGRCLPAASVAGKIGTVWALCIPDSGEISGSGETSGRAERALTGLKETGAGGWLPPPPACDCGHRAFLWPCASACGWSLHPVAAPWRWL